MSKPLVQLTVVLLVLLHTQMLFYYASCHGDALFTGTNNGYLRVTGKHVTESLGVSLHRLQMGVQSRGSLPTCWETAGHCTSYARQPSVDVRYHHHQGGWQEVVQNSFGGFDRRWFSDGGSSGGGGKL